MSTSHKSFKWMVIGAGPGGITALGKLLDAGVSAQDIAWVDPEFKVGDLGTKWPNVSSNTRVELFLKFLQHCEAFHYADREQRFVLDDLNPNDTCQLQNIVEPLQWVTEQLVKQINPIKGYASNLRMNDRQWHMTINEEDYCAQQVVLALGSEPSILDYPQLQTISLTDAIDAEKIANHCTPQDTVAVFGSSHSAIIIIRNLIELGVKQVINFYRSPLRFAIPMDGWTLFDNTGLKGETAEWAKTHLNGNVASNCQRIVNTSENRQSLLPQCNKAVYAVGFTPRTISNEDNLPLTHNTSNGIIAPGLFGCGIAYPELVTDPFGAQENNVGLWKFMNYVDRVLPLWLKYSG